MGYIDLIRRHKAERDMIRNQIDAEQSHTINGVEQNHSLILLRSSYRSLVALQAIEKREAKLNV